MLSIAKTEAWVKWSVDKDTGLSDLHSLHMFKTSFISATVYHVRAWDVILITTHLEEYVKKLGLGLTHSYTANKWQRENLTDLPWF